MGKKLTNRIGFSLLEIVITIAILVTGVVVPLQMFGIGMFADTNVENATTALNLAQEKMEEIKDAPYADIDSFAASRASLGGDFADFDREITVSGDPKQVNVIVYWTVKGDDQSVNLVTLFADY